MNTTLQTGALPNLTNSLRADARQLKHDCANAPLLLVVVEDAGVSAVLVRFFHAEGFRCVVEPSIEDALQAMQDLCCLELEVAGLLTDFDLPDGAGIEVVLAFRARFADSPVAIMSCCDAEENLEGPAALNVTRLSKPLALDSLRSWIQKTRCGPAVPAK
ncbi:MAG: response regulator [Planctomycetes bacterium]|nr:response regulator [Planctomycetota bacterium]